MTHYLNTFPNLKLDLPFSSIYDFNTKNGKVEELQPLLIHPLEVLILWQIKCDIYCGLSKLFKNCPKLKKNKLN